MKTAVVCCLVVAGLFAIGLVLPAFAQDTGTLDKESAEKAFPAKPPY